LAKGVKKRGVRSNAMYNGEKRAKGNPKRGRWIGSLSMIRISEADKSWESLVVEVAAVAVVVAVAAAFAVAGPPRVARAQGRLGLLEARDWVQRQRAAERDVGCKASVAGAGAEAAVEVVGAVFGLAKAAGSVGFAAAVVVAAEAGRQA